MEKVLSWLVGRKALFVSVGLLVVSFLVKDHTLSSDLGFLLSSVLSLIGGGAHLATQDLMGANRLGFKK